MYKYLFWLCHLLLPLSVFCQSVEVQPPRILSFDEALELAIFNNPGLRVLDAGREEAYGNLEQATSRPNPVISTEVENFLGSGSMQGVDALEITVSVSQVIETSRKRELRSAQAQALVDGVAWERQLQVAALEADLREACVNVSLAKALLELRREQLELAEAYAQETSRLVDAARVFAVELTRSQLELGKLRLALLQAERESKALGVRLALLLGLPPGQVVNVRYEESLELEHVDLQGILERLPATQALRRFKQEAAIGQAELNLEQVAARPDLEVMAGVRYANEEGGDAGFVAGVSIPWPLFDNNKGNIRAARARLRSIEYQRDALHRELVALVVNAYEELDTARETSLLIQNELLPMARQALSETQAAFDKGQVMFRDVLDARRALMETREALLDETRRYITARAQIDRTLAGVSNSESLTQ